MRSNFTGSFVVLPCHTDPLSCPVKDQLFQTSCGMLLHQMQLHFQQVSTQSFLLQLQQKLLFVKLDAVVLAVVVVAAAVISAVGTTFAVVVDCIVFVAVLIVGWDVLVVVDC
jgi:hypothetical protein